MRQPCLIEEPWPVVFTSVVDQSAGADPHLAVGLVDGFLLVVLICEPLPLFWVDLSQDLLVARELSCLGDEFMQNTCCWDERLNTGVVLAQIFHGHLAFLLRQIVRDLRDFVA